MPTSLTTPDILAARGPKNRVDVSRPYAYLIEDERSAAGGVEPVATLFLTNRECPFHCLYCDLWKNITDETLALGLPIACGIYPKKGLRELAMHVLPGTQRFQFGVQAIAVADV